MVDWAKYNWNLSTEKSMNEKAIHKAKRYYIRGRRKSPMRMLTEYVALIAVLVSLTIWLWRISDAPHWRHFIGHIFVVLPLYFLLMLQPHYYFFDEETLSLWQGNDFTKKQRLVASLSEYFEVTYLPHTREVKLKKQSGVTFLKFYEGEAFIDHFQRLFEQVVAQEEKRESLETEN